MRRHHAFPLAVFLFGTFALCGAYGEFALDDDGYGLTVLDQGRPVLTYQYAGRPLKTENGQDTTGPAAYIHPVYGLMGELVTGDSPSLWGDLPGLHWGWAYCVVNGDLIDTWNGEGGRREFERWKEQYAGEDSAEFAVQNAWIRNGDDVAQVLESVLVTVYPAEGKTRNVDLFIEFKNVTFNPVYLRGSGPESGLAVRLNPERQDWTFTGGSGRVTPGGAPILSPWLDCSYRDDRHSTYSGVAILQHSSNPGYSDPNWTVTPEGIVSAGVSTTQQMELKPGQSVSFGYRLILHRGFGPSMNLMREYVKWTQPETRAPGTPGLPQVK